MSALALVLLAALAREPAPPPRVLTLVCRTEYGVVGFAYVKTWIVQGDVLDVRYGPGRHATLHVLSCEPTEY